MLVMNAIGWFFSGVLLINVLPHLIRGISGDRFPSAFAKPHGKKLSSPTLNVIWAFINLSIFLTILYFNQSSFTALYAVIMLIGAFIMAVYLSKYFAGKDQD
jgi:hypothetical protein